MLCEAIERTKKLEKRLQEFVHEEKSNSKELPVCFKKAIFFAGTGSKFILVNFVVFNMKFSVVCRRDTCRLSLPSNRHGRRNRQGSSKKQPWKVSR